MATVTRTNLLDDLDGSPAEETVAFGLDGSRYEIDLSQAHADLLRDRLARFMEVARRVPTTAPVAKRGRPRSAADSDTPKLIRAWASEEGIALSYRGRISADIIEQYNAAHH